MNGDTWIFLALCGALLVFLLMASFLSKSYSLDRIKSKTVGDGQHGTARWATPKEIGKTYHTVPFRPRRWRKGKELPTEQGLILGSVGGGKRTKSLNQYASSVADAAAQLVAALNDANHGSRKISFTIGGNFIIFAGNNVRIEGFGPKIDGKYFVDKTTRTIDRNGFSCKIEASGIDDPFYAWQVGGSIKIHEKSASETATKYDSTYETTKQAPPAQRQRPVRERQPEPADAP